MTVDELYEEVIDLRNTMDLIDTNLRKSMDTLRTGIQIKMDHYVNELDRLESTIDRAFLDAVHELLDYLRHEDIQSLDEEEFAQRVKELIGQSYVPF